MINKFDLAMEYQNDLELIRAIRSGDHHARESAVSHLYEKYFYLVFQAIKKYQWKRESLVDAYADAITNLTHYISKDQFDLKTNLGALLRKIFKNRIRDEQRAYFSQRESNRRDSHVALLEYSLERDVNPNPEQELIFKDLVQTVQQILPELGTSCERILTLIIFKCCSYEETGKILGLGSVDTVRVRKSQCMKRLRKFLR